MPLSLHRPARRSRTASRFHFIASSPRVRMTDSESSPTGPDSPQQVRQQHVSARVPDGIGRGVFSNGVIVMSGGSEFVLDFIQNLGHPPQVAARVVMPHNTLPQFIQALQKNIEMFNQRFGDIPELPKANQPQRQQTAQEIYDELKLSDELLSGSYANGVMIGHSASEFKLDFLTNLFPHPAVSSRIYLSSPQVPRMLESLQRNYQQFVDRVKQQQQRPDQGPSSDAPPPPEVPPT